MKKIKINRNKKSLPDERINSHKDFNKILSNYQQLYDYRQAGRPLYKNPKFLGFIFLMFLLTFVIITVTEQEEQWEKARVRGEEKPIRKDSSSNTAAYDSTANFLSEPAETIPLDKSGTSIKKESFTRPGEKDTIAVKTALYTLKVDPVKGMIAYLPNGIRIIIPSNAFVNNLGEAITEEVSIFFQAITEQNEIASSGLNFSYSSNNIGTTIYPAAVVKVEAKNRNHKVFINPKSSIEIELISPITPQLSMFQLRKEQWTNKEAVHSVARFEIQADSNIREMAAFKSLLAEIDLKDLAKYSYVFHKTWRDIRIQKDQTLPFSYTLSLKTSGSSVNIPFEVSRLIQDEEAHNKLLEAKFDLYQQGFSKKTTQTSDSKKRNDAWIMSNTGNSYFEWVRSTAVQQSLRSDKMVIVCQLKNFGVYTIGLFEKSVHPKRLNDSIYSRVLIITRSDEKKKGFYQKGDQEITEDFRMKN